MDDSPEVGTFFAYLDYVLILYTSLPTLSTLLPQNVLRSSILISMMNREILLPLILGNIFAAKAYVNTY
jgi:hypothetical protein